MKDVGRNGSDPGKPPAYSRGSRLKQGILAHSNAVTHNWPQFVCGNNLRRHARAAIREESPWADGLGRRVITEGLACCEYGRLLCPLPYATLLMKVTFREKARGLRQAGTWNRLSRRALVTTLTLEKAMASAANIGESRMPKKG